jgi:uncharacterized protein
VTDPEKPQQTTSGGVQPHLAIPGKLSYIEIPALDPQRSGDFYRSVFGWNIRGGGPTHVGFDDAGQHLIGHFTTRDRVVGEPGIVPYIYVQGIDAALSAIAEHGGQVVSEPHPEGKLWVATFRDPAGNLIGIWQAGPR